MEDERFQGLRAYENREWLQSRGARLVRIMSEFIEPADRLKQEKVSGSILVFGSARVKSPEQWKEIQENLENELIESPRKPEIIEKLRLHARLKSSSKYYHDVVELCRRLTGPLDFCLCIYICDQNGQIHIRLRNPFGALWKE